MRPAASDRQDIGTEQDEWCRPRDLGGTPARYAGEGMACPDCDATYHKECLEKKALCPNCQRDLNEAKNAMDVKDQQEKEQAKRLHAAGKVALFSLIGIGFMLFRILEVLTENKPKVMCYPYLLAIIVFLAGIVMSFWRAVRKQGA